MNNNSKIRSRRYWFIFVAVFVITQAILYQVLGLVLDNMTNLMIHLGIGLVFSVTMTPLLMKW